MIIKHTASPDDPLVTTKKKQQGVHKHKYLDDPDAPTINVPTTQYECVQSHTLARSSALAMATWDIYFYLTSLLSLNINRMSYVSIQSLLVIIFC